MSLCIQESKNIFLKWNYPEVFLTKPCQKFINNHYLIGFFIVILTSFVLGFIKILTLCLTGLLGLVFMPLVGISKLLKKDYQAAAHWMGAWVLNLITLSIFTIFFLTIILQCSSPVAFCLMAASFGLGITSSFYVSLKFNPNLLRIFNKEIK